MSKLSNVSTDSLQLDYSYGFDCHRLYNLAFLGEDTLVHATGRLMHFYDINTAQISYMTSTTGEGFGHFTTHPESPLLAVGEKGQRPPIIIYKWPERTVVTTFQKNSTTGFNCLSFSADGELLASLGSAPDRLLTLWVWRKSEILLQTKAFEHDIYHVAFSQFNPEQLATCGVGHLKVWRMSKTFTGLKLQGDLGQFGKIETCDLTSVLPLPDGSCATGSEWGNLLIWAEGAIKLEVFRVGKLPCHKGPITHVIFENNAILTAGLDGAIRVWHYENIELADPSEEKPFIEVEPMLEIFLRDGAVTSQILSLCRNTNDSSMWFIQDMSGSIWSSKISTKEVSSAPERVYCCHAGAVVGLETSPATTMFATLGVDGRIIVYNYLERTMVTSQGYTGQGSCLLWPSLDVISSGEILFVGFSNGLLRVIAVQNGKLRLIEALKPHSASIVSMTITSDVLLTASNDMTVFMLRLVTDQKSMFQPFGFCRLDGGLPTCVAWISDEFLVGCESGRILKFKLPKALNFETSHSYELVLNYSELNLAQLTKNLHADEDQDGRTMGKVRFVLTENDESLILAFEGKLEIYKYSLKEEILMILNSEVLPSNISCLHYRKLDNLLIVGLTNGKLEAMRLVGTVCSAVADWSMGLHDKDRGRVVRVASSWDGRYILSCGSDGGVFCFLVISQQESVVAAPKITPTFFEHSKSMDIEEPDALSLEQAKVKQNLDGAEAAAQQQKQSVKSAIKKLEAEYGTILSKNSELPAILRLGDDELVADQRVVNDLMAKLHSEMELVYRKLGRSLERSSIGLRKIRRYFLDDIEKLSVKVKAIYTADYVESFRVTKLPKDFFEDMAAIQKTLDAMEIRGSTESTPQPPEAQAAPPPEEPDPVSSLLKQVSVLGDVTRSRKLTALWRQHELRREAASARKLSWDEHMRREPDRLRAGADDSGLIEAAREALGDYKLKTSSDYKVPRHKNETTASKMKELLDTKLRIYNIMTNFNKRVFELRDKKQNIIAQNQDLNTMLEAMINEIPEESRKVIRNFPEIDRDLEFPEDMFKLSEDDILNQVSVELRPYAVTLPPLEKTNDNTVPEIQKIEPKTVASLIEKQNANILRMENDIANIDAAIAELMEEKVDIEADLKFLELHLLTLHREALVLQQFETDEHLKLEKSLDLLKEKYDLQVSMNKLTTQMEIIIGDINLREESIKTLVTTFHASIVESKFYDFLKKMFKKKYKVPKEQTEDSEDSFSSESESDSEEDIGKSLDSNEFNLANLEEGICPDGCDPDLYESTLKNRDARHQLEFEVSDLKRDVDGLKKSFEAMGKKMIKIDVEYERAQNDCDVLQRQKQIELNKIETVVVLRLSQMQNLKNREEMTNLDESLVFSADMLSQLYNRVGELTRETQHQSEIHGQNKHHIQRLGIDIRHMTSQISVLEKEINEAMLRKFGCKVDLDELDEALVKKLVAEMNFIPFELQQSLERKLIGLKKRLTEKVDAYTARLSENTKRYNLMAVLMDEINKLEDTLDKQPKEGSAARAVRSSELCHLSNLVKSQEDEVTKLRQEICNLRQKTCPPPPPGAFGTSPIPAEPTVLIDGPDGKSYCVDASVWKKMQTTAAETEAFIEQFKSSGGAGDPKRLKALVEEFLAELPEPVLRPVWELLCGCRDGDLSDILDDDTALCQAVDLMKKITASTKEKSDFYQDCYH